LFGVPPGVMLQEQTIGKENRHKFNHKCRETEFR
jgi:hypothetical protein